MSYDRARHLKPVMIVCHYSMTKIGTCLPFLQRRLRLAQSLGSHPLLHPRQNSHQHSRPPTIAPQCPDGQRWPCRQYTGSTTEQRSHWQQHSRFLGHLGWRFQLGCLSCLQWHQWPRRSTQCQPHLPNLPQRSLLPLKLHSGPPKFRFSLNY